MLPRLRFASFRLGPLTRCRHVPVIKESTIGLQHGALTQVPSTNDPQPAQGVRDRLDARKAYRDGCFSWSNRARLMNKVLEKRVLNRLPKGVTTVLEEWDEPLSRHPNGT